MAGGHLHTDVLIAGGGPAGGAAAILCAGRGLGVVLAEREARPRDKPGEALHPGIEPLLGQLGVADRLQGVVGARHRGVWVEWGGPRRFEPFGEDPDGPWLGFQVRRSGFDALLLQRAQELGAEIRRGCRVLEPAQASDGSWRIESSAGAVSCRILIDATGAAGWLSRRLRLSRKVCSPPLVARYGYVEGRCLTHNEAPSLVGDRTGWTWSARVAPDVYQWVRLDLETGAEPRNPVPEAFRRLRPRGAIRGADVTWRLCEPAAGPGWFVAGDAAALLDPASSHGVLKAVMSGMMAAHMATGVLRHGVPTTRATAEYSNWLRGWFWADCERLRDLYRKLGAGA
jgi:flavin-dependent dehydrogenase